MPNKSATKKGEPYRFLAIREPLKQPHLPMDCLPFQTIDFNETQYKLFGIVANMDWEGDKLIDWHHERCGKSEEAHAVMKEDLAGGRLPSGKFGENAAWWWIMILTHNLNAVMKSLVLQGAWAAKRMKAVRFRLINLPGRVMEHARGLVVPLAGNHPSFDLLLSARQRILEFAYAASG